MTEGRTGREGWTGVLTWTVPWLRDGKRLSEWWSGRRCPGVATDSCVGEEGLDPEDLGLGLTEGRYGGGSLSRCESRTPGHLGSDTEGWKSGRRSSDGRWVTGRQVWTRP